MKRNRLKIISLVLGLALLFTACGYRIGQDEVTNDPAKESTEEKEPGLTAVTSQEGEVTNPGDDKFTICWDPADSLNPYDNMCAENAAIMGLVYEGLFDVGSDFKPINCLCDNYTVENTTYTINIVSDVKFHDGSRLTAEDVRYSIERGRESEKYGTRFKNIASVELVSEEKLRIILNTPDYTLPSLLDIPIIKNGTGDFDSPIGSGPYVLRETESTLTYYPEYRAEMPLSVIYLMDTEDITPAAALSQRKADLILYDTSAGSLDVYIDHETHYYDTTVLQYIGFNTHHYIAGYAEVRRAMGHLINREGVISKFPAGSAVPATLALSRLALGYDEDLEEQTAYSIQKFTEILSAMNVADNNGDGWLELNGATLSFSFVVCDSSPYISQAASEITDIMRSVGINVILKRLPYEEYIKALEEGRFDMYYGEVRLPTNFDLSQILGYDGALNYGGSSGYDNAMTDYLMADTDETKTAAFRELCQDIYDNAPIIPVCWKRNAIAFERDAIKGVNPTQQNVFWEFGKWEFDGEIAE